MKQGFQVGRLVFALWCFCFSLTANALLPGYGINRLFTVSEWNQLCHQAGLSLKPATCKERLFQAYVRGRTLGQYEQVIPNDSNLLQTRSGVLLRNKLNDMVVEVREDKGLRTTVKLMNDVKCQAYSASPDLVGSPVSGADYTRLIQSWLGVYANGPSETRSIDVVKREGVRVLHFEAVTEGEREVRGMYWLDAKSNASIFTTCDYPAQLTEAGNTAELFFQSIVGSARRYIRV